MTRVVSIAIVSFLAASGAAPTIRFDRTTHDFGANPKMPGFSSLVGGPLDEAQVTALVRLLRAPRPDEQ